MDKKFLAYCEAFANLYGEISCDQAFRLMRKLEPDFKIDKLELMDWFDEHEDKTSANFVVLDMFGTAMIVHNDIDDQELEENLLADQIGKPFYIPEREELLKYQSNYYFEENDQAKAYEQVLEKVLKVPSLRVQDLTCKTIRSLNNYFFASMGDSLKEVQELLEREGYQINTEEDFKAWIEALMNLQNHSHLWFNRGWKPIELRNQPNAYDFLGQPHNFTDEIKEMLENYELDPMDIVVGMPDDLSEFKQSKVLANLNRLNIESLGDDD